MLVENTRAPSFFQKPPKYREGDDPETFVMFYDLLATSNKWTELESAQRLPTYFPLTLLPWYISLDDEIKMNYGRLKAAFVERFDLGSDRQQLLIDYHDLRAKNSSSLGDYAAQVQSIGLKLNKTAAENLLQFKLGLPVPTFKWIEERKPKSMEAALRLAVDFDAMFGKSVARRAYVPFAAPSSERVHEPMEHIQKATPASDRYNQRGGYQRDRVFTSRNSGGTSSAYRNQSSGTDFRYHQSQRGGHRGGNSNRGQYSPSRGHQGAGNRPPQLRNYQMADNCDEGRDELQEDIDFTAEWFRETSGNEDLPVVQTH